MSDWIKVNGELFTVADIEQLTATQKKLDAAEAKLAKARQETLREVMPSLKFLLHCVSQTPWIAEGPGDITNPMFLGTGSVDGDQEVHGKYLNAKELLKKLEAEREASDV